MAIEIKLVTVTPKKTFAYEGKMYTPESEPFKMDDRDVSILIKSGHVELDTSKNGK